MDTLNWKEHITADPEVLAGKPVVKGTRLSVEWILELLAEGWDEKRILENYPQIDMDDLRAVFAYLSACVKDEEYVLLNQVQA